MDNKLFDGNFLTRYHSNPIMGRTGPKSQNIPPSGHEFVVSMLIQR